jgi:hypothetical protein
MKTILQLLVGSVLVTLPVPGWCTEQAASTTSVDFAREILPILSNKCFVCHGPSAEDPNQLRLDTEQDATADRGGYRGVNPDNPSKSELLRRIHSQTEPMPPAEAKRQLTPGERELLTQWIREGGKYTRHWSFVPPTISHPRSNPTAERHEIIDAFILDGLQAAGIDFAPEADKAFLARRVALVLTGLPPEIDQLEAFLGDNHPDAYERYVDSLLQSPRFGEHQARYWLDAIRYGDTHGLHLDNRRGIYPYRDWVVNALNNNLPLDKFITWQLAGDLLSDPTLAQQVATGFVRMNPTTSEGGVIPEEFQAKNNFDRIETLGTVLLGMSLTCARCHTHKYDPITQTEYYQLLAFFNSTAENSLDGNAYIYKPIISAPNSQANWIQWNRLEEQRDGLITRAQTWIDSQADFAGHTRTTWDRSNRDEKLGLLAEANGNFAPAELSEEAGKVAAQTAEARKSFTTTLVARDLPEPRVTRLLNRGEYDQPEGDPLEPNALRVMGEFPENAPRNRLGLAQWLTSPDHPLVRRVLLNSIWQRTFGDGLVRTPEDFGLQGEQPTHPELLDWLAIDLSRSGWDLKDMLRLMVTSRTFRQSSAWRTDVDDPENRLFARGPRYRLDAEVLRDIGLWAGGLLDPVQGGEGIKPYQPAGLWKALAHPSSNTKQYVPDRGSIQYRRSIYLYWKRTSPHPMMTLFDAPDRESSCVKRSTTNTPLQSLGLLNEIQRITMGRSLAERLLREADTDTERLNLLFRLLASRSPDKRERAACATLLETLRDRYAGAQDDAVALLSLGDVQPNPKLNTTEYAAWTQVAVTVLASDPSILLY